MLMPSQNRTDDNTSARYGFTMTSQFTPDKQHEPWGIRGILQVQEVVRPLQLDERMIALAAAISIDFDYFSQHSHGPGEQIMSRAYCLFCT